MYAQSFRQDLLKQEIDSMQTSIDDCLNGRGVKDGLKNGVKERQAPTCLFWKNGECQRGKMCKFYHDPNVKQKVPERREMAQNTIACRTVRLFGAFRSQHCTYIGNG